MEQEGSPVELSSKYMYNSLLGIGNDVEPEDSAPQSSPKDRLNTSIEWRRMNRMKKYRVSKKVAQSVKQHLDELNLDDDEMIEVMFATLKRMGFKNSQLKSLRKEETRGRKITSLEERTKAWDFWHANSDASTLTSRPAKIRVDRVPKLQQGLKIHITPKEVTNKRGVELYESPWLLTNNTVRVLFRKFKREHNSSMSLGTFLALRPFYVRAPTGKDIEMCVCKDHLHARWAVNAIVKLAKKQSIPIDFDSYESFFSNSLYSPQCKLGEDASEYIKWECTPSKKELCDHIAVNFENLKHEILSLAGEDVETVKMLHFIKKEERTRKGKWVKRLKAVPVQANFKWLLKFTSEMLPKIVHHRNLLSNYRNNIQTLMNLIPQVTEIGLDFSENLTIPVPEEPLSLHWGGCKEDVTIHSGKSERDGVKTYHAYISDDLTHDQAFVKIAIREILDDIKISPGDTLIVISDNCTSQYKSAHNFHDLESLAKEYKINIVRIYGIPGHGKNEIDTVGGTQKIAIRRAVSNRMVFDRASACVDFLQEKFGDSESPIYDIKEIFPEQLEVERKSAGKRKYPTVDGSSLIRIILFKWDSDVIKAAPYLCVCEKCELDIGSCDLYYEMDLTSYEKRARKPTTRRDMTESSDDDMDDDEAPQENDDDDDDDEVCPDYYTPETVCAIAPDDEAHMLYFIHIVGSGTAETDLTDSYDMTVEEGEDYIWGHYLEVDKRGSKGVHYKVSEKTVFFYKTSIVYPFVDVDEQYDRKGKMVYYLDNVNYCDILRFVEETKMSML